MKGILGSTKNASAPGVDTLIGRQTELLGDVRFSGGLHIDGKVKGKVLASGDDNAVVSVSETGAIEGDVRVPNIHLNGTVVGDVHASERITLSVKARVTGNVYYKVLEMASGAAVNGQLVHEGDEQPAAITHQKREPREEAAVTVELPTSSGKNEKPTPVEQRRRRV